MSNKTFKWDGVEYNIETAIDRLTDNLIRQYKWITPRIADDYDYLGDQYHKAARDVRDDYMNQGVNHSGIIRIIQKDAKREQLVEIINDLVAIKDEEN